MPDWSTAELYKLPVFMPTLEERMAVVIKFARLNFERNTGGPFAAGVFEKESGKLISIGVNRVMSSHCSSAHAEIMALSLAQKKLGNYDLGASGMAIYQLVVNWRPCAMCYGAVLWSGVRSLAIAGSGDELEKITGFDEGPIHPQWREQLKFRGIELIDNIMRESAIQVFQDFAQSSSFVYNARLGNF